MKTINTIPMPLATIDNSKNNRHYQFNFALSDGSDFTYGVDANSHIEALDKIHNLFGSRKFNSLKVKPLNKA